MAERPSRNDGVTIGGRETRETRMQGCAVCGRPFPVSGRRRFCSPACRQAAWRRRQPSLPPPPPLPTRAPRAATVYECPLCGVRFLGEQRCPDCNVFCRRLGPGARCPHCDEPIALTDLMPIQTPGRHPAPRGPPRAAGHAV
jgi:hypothetical protein